MYKMKFIASPIMDFGALKGCIRIEPEGLDKVYI